ncbi:hypothetical protein J7E50_10765 [Pedobacter sp. ISL-68]|nr:MULTISPECIES: hypothetical protein [unclassified Pedobacter]MBT2561313.1 hypothetical protein [Pedobacter sp. ISL-64]MBT2590702.1 hypothetical protein [Pedobacter sp. ISL-68]
MKKQNQPVRADRKTVFTFQKKKGAVDQMSAGTTVYTLPTVSKTCG